MVLEACSFRDAAKELLELGVSHTFGVSTQDTEYQQELRERIHLPYHILSDEKLGLVKALNLPTFEFQGATLIKRLTLAVEDGKIVHTWYVIVCTPSSLILTVTGILSFRLIKAQNMSSNG